MFKLKSNFAPSGDQVDAIKKLTDGVNNNVKEQVLLGVTGSGKTFTMANIINNTNKPTLILAHNKTLAGQLYSEFKELFPENAVEYFISYYDYYQPEAYSVATDTYVEKDASINDEIDEMRHSATASLLERRDVIVIASVSCIYGIGDPEDYKNSLFVIRRGMELPKKELMDKLIELHYQRNDVDFKRGTFRTRGQIVDIIPSREKTNGIRVEYFDDEIEEIKIIDTLTGEVLDRYDYITIFPATHFMTNKEKLDEALRRIEEELESQIKFFKDSNKPLEAERIEQRTRYDLEMLREMGSCSGIENYSRHLSLSKEGETPSTLIDFFPDDFLLIVDESHVTLPQVRGMYNGNRSRKQNLIDYGFRLPSSLDNRPLTFEEFYKKINQAIYVSATPGEYETENHFDVAEQIIRPTGLLDPIVEVRPTNNQIDVMIEEIKKRTQINERVLITTFTKKMSEDLTVYLRSIGIKVAYLHSEIKALERIEIIRNLRLGTYDCLVGVNLLREGLDIPEVSLVCIMDADKPGFLRSERSLIQTIGRAARNANGRVILFADSTIEAMQNAIIETNRRREIQMNYNKLHNIVPKTIIKKIPEAISIKNNQDESKPLTKKEKQLSIKELEKKMNEAAKVLDFERAMELRDIILEMKASIN